MSMTMEYRDGRVFFFRGSDEMPFPRYDILKKYCNGIVADLACGSGYGTFLLSKHATFVYGFDVSEEAVAFARTQWQQPNIEFRALNIEKDVLPIKYDCIISCETIEHINRPTKETLALFRDGLVSGGILGMTYPEQEQIKADFHIHSNISNAEVLEMLTDLGFVILRNETTDGTTLLVAKLK